MIQKLDPYILLNSTWVERICAYYESQISVSARLQRVTIDVVKILHRNVYITLTCFSIRILLYAFSSCNYPFTMLYIELSVVEGLQSYGE